MLQGTGIHIGTHGGSLLIFLIFSLIFIGKIVCWIVELQYLQIKSIVVAWCCSNI